MKEKLMCLYDDANYCNPDDCGLYNSNRRLRTEFKDKVIASIQEIEPTVSSADMEDTPYIDPLDLRLLEAEMEMRNPNLGPPPCPHFKPTKIKVRIG